MKEFFRDEKFKVFKSASGSDSDQSGLSAHDESEMEKEESVEKSSSDK